VSATPLARAPEEISMKKKALQPKEPNVAPPAPASDPHQQQPAHPAPHRHPHAVIHPADGSVSHTEPGGTIHI
jgi:hypothetical protein